MMVRLPSFFFQHQSLLYLFFSKHALKCQFFIPKYHSSANFPEAGLRIVIRYYNMESPPEVNAQMNRLLLSPLSIVRPLLSWIVLQHQEIMVSLLEPLRLILAQDICALVYDIFRSNRLLLSSWHRTIIGLILKVISPRKI